MEGEKTTISTTSRERERESCNFFFLYRHECHTHNNLNTIEREREGVANLLFFYTVMNVSEKNWCMVYTEQVP